MLTIEKLKIGIDLEKGIKCAGEKCYGSNRNGRHLLKVEISSDLRHPGSKMISYLVEALKGDRPKLIKRAQLDESLRVKVDICLINIV